MTLSDLKKAAAARQGQEPELHEQVQSPAPAPARTPPSPEPKTTPTTTSRKPRATSAKATPVPDGRTKMLGARVPLAIHREFQQHIFRAQEEYPDLTMQEAVPALIRLLRDEKVWNKFMAELSEA